MNNNYIIILFLVLGIVLCETIAQSCIKYSRNTNNKNYICISVLFYAIVCFLLYKTYKYQNMGIIQAKMSSNSKGRMSIITKLGALFNQARGGELEQVKFI